MVPGPRNCFFIDRTLWFAKILSSHRRYVGLRAIQTNVPLALLLGVVKRMGVQKRPNELPADVFEAKFEVSVLINSVMSAKKGAGTDIHALFLGDLFPINESWRVTGARGRDGGVKRMREAVAKSYARRCGFYLRLRKRIRYRRQLRGHLLGIVHRTVEENADLAQKSQLF